MSKSTVHLGILNGLDDIVHYYYTYCKLDKEFKKIEHFGTDPFPSFMKKFVLFHHSCSGFAQNSPRLPQNLTTSFSKLNNFV